MHSVLEVYRNAVIAWSEASDNNTKKINAINSFLKSNTTFPLVVGRERIVDSKVRAYFTAYSMLLQLQKRGFDGYSDFTTEEERCWLEIFFCFGVERKCFDSLQIDESKTDYYPENAVWSCV